MRAGGPSQQNNRPVCSHAQVGRDRQFTDHPTHAMACLPIRPARHCWPSPPRGSPGWPGRGTLCPPERDGAAGPTHLRRRPVEWDRDYVVALPHRALVQSPGLAPLLAWAEANPARWPPTPGTGQRPPHGVHTSVPPDRGTSRRMLVCRSMLHVSLYPSCLPGQLSPATPPPSVLPNLSPRHCCVGQFVHIVIRIAIFPELVSFPPVSPILSSKHWPGLHSSIDPSI